MSLWAYLLAILPFFMVIAFEAILNKYLKALPSQMILQIGRVAGILFHLAVVGYFMVKGWLDVTSLFSFPALSFSVALSSLFFGGITWLATMRMRTRGVKSQRNLQYVPMEGGHLLVYAIIWAGYLFIYEIFIRGLLLPAGLHPVWLLVLCNSLFYALIHLQRGLRETGGALVFGLAGATITLWVGSILPVFVAHFIIALQMDIRPTWRQNAVR